MSLSIGGLWRYPVKTLAGEALESADLTGLGLVGDRVVHVRGPEGVRTARNHHLGYHRLLGLHGTLGSDGEPLVDGFTWNSREALALVQRHAGSDAVLASHRGPERFDVLPLLVATDGAVAAFGRDVRRLRPNILVSGVDGLAEREWQGCELHVGEAVIEIDSLRPRCPMTTIDPDTLERDPGVLRDIARRFGGLLALNCSVKRPGRLNLGDTVRLVHPGVT